MVFRLQALLLLLSFSLFAEEIVGRLIPMPGRWSFSVFFCVTAASSSAGTSGAATVAAVGGSETGGLDGASGAGPLGLRSVGRRRRIVFIGAGASFVAGATPMADSSEIREVFDFAACCCAGVRMPSATMPVFRRVACMGIGPVTAFRFCVAFFAAAGDATAVVAGAGGFAPPMTGLRIIGLRMTGLSLIVETPA